MKVFKRKNIKNFSENFLVSVDKKENSEIILTPRFDKESRIHCLQAVFEHVSFEKKIFDFEVKFF